MADKTPQATAYKRLTVAVQKIQAAAEDMRKAGCTDKMIVALLHDSTKVPKRTITIVLDGMGALADTYLNVPENL